MGEIHKFALIGCGAIGAAHAKVINEIPNAKLAAVVSRGELGKEFAEKFNCNYYNSIESLIEKEDFSIASICTPSSTHGSIAMYCAEHGKNLIIEKPLDVSLSAIDQLVEVCNSKKVKACTIFQHRFDNDVIKAKKAIEEGKLGRLFFGACHTKWYRDQNYYDRGGWRGTWAFDGGGALINQSIHYIDLLLHFMGDISELHGYCGTYAHEIETEDMGVATVKFKNGGLGIIEGTTAAYPGMYTKLDLYGEHGSLSIQNDSIIMYKVKGMSQEEETYMLGESNFNGETGSSIESLKSQYLDMLHAIESEIDPLIGLKEGRRSTAVVLAIYKSWKSGRSVIV